MGEYAPLVANILGIAPDKLKSKLYINDNFVCMNIWTIVALEIYQNFYVLVLGCKSRFSCQCGGEAVQTQRDFVFFVCS